MPAHQIWSCQVAQDANFKNFYFVLILHLILGIPKSHKISSGKALYFRNNHPKTSRGVENNPPPPPVPLGLSEQEGRKLDLK